MRIGLVCWLVCRCYLQLMLATRDVVSLLHLTLVLEHCCAVDIPAPSYQEFRNGSNFSIECSIAARPGQPFGDRNVLFNSKKSARRHSARQAVLWLRTRGDMLEKGHPSKKKARAAANATTMAAVNAPSAGPSVSITSSLSNPNVSAPSSSIAIAGGAPPSPSTSAAQSKTGLTTTSDATGTSPPSSSSSNSNSPLNSPLPVDLSPGEQLNRLCTSLGIAQPTFCVTADPRVPSMWSGAAFFPHDPLVAAPGEPVGQVTNVYGKANARKEIAKRVVRVLLKMREERKRIAERVIGGLRTAGSASASANASPSPSGRPSMTVDREEDSSAVEARVGMNNAEDVVMGEDARQVG
ncbi:hypothetical protein BKA80DRAFT_89290 [Phyllosticta citrichinensis]